MERLRLFISQIIASIVVAVATIWFCRGIIICTRLASRFLKLQNYNASVSIVLLIGIFCVGALAMKIILWLMREPMLEQEEIDMGTVENIPKER